MNYYCSQLIRTNTEQISKGNNIINSLKWTFEWAVHIFILLCLILTLTTKPDPILAATTSGNYTYTVIDETAKTARLNRIDNASGHVDIPSVVDGYTITSLGNIVSGNVFVNASWQSNNTVTSVTIPSSVTTIGSLAFCECSGLTDVTIPDSVTSIGDCAFDSCTLLNNIDIPSSVKSIGLSPFRSCTSLTAIDVDSRNINYRSVDEVLYNYALTELIQYPAGKVCDTYQLPNGVINIKDQSFYGCIGLLSVNIPNTVTYIGTGAFENSSSLISIVIPNSVINIGNSAFYNCANLTNVILSNRINKIDSLTFYHCNSLTSITIPGSAQGIGWAAFESCTSLSSATIESGVSYIQTEAFKNCTGLTNLTIPNTLMDIHSKAFYNCNNLTGLLIPEGVKTINFMTFWGCSKLTELSIPNSVTYLGDQAFQKCTGLTSVTIGNGITEIGISAFSDCTSLKDVVLPESLTSIGPTNFTGCTTLTTINIPNNLTNIGAGAFSNCSKIDGITLPDSLTSIGGAAFYNCSSLTGINIPIGVTSIGTKPFANCTRLCAINVDIGNASYVSSDGVLLNKNGTNLIQYPAGKEDVSYQVADGVTSIGDSAFQGCSNLINITIPNTVTNIAYSAFANCSCLTTIIIPKGVIDIGPYAFSQCSGLTSIIFKSTTTTIFNDKDTIPSITTIIGYDPSTAKSYATRYGRTFDDIVQASFYTSPSISIVGQSTRFTSTSQSWDSIITSYNWNFGDGKTASGATVNHVYSSPGTYTATLTITLGDGTTKIVSKTITVHELAEIGPTPVIIVPGTMGSRLVVKDTDPPWIIWLQSLSEQENLLLNDDGSDMYGLIADQIFDFEDINNNGTADMYGSLEDYLESLGIPVEVWPYDWRLDINKNAVEFAAFVDTIANKYGGQVDVISHSQGGLIVKKYLYDHPDNTTVRKYIAIAPIQLGAPRSFGAWATGVVNQGVFDKVNFTDNDIVREMAHNSPAIYEMIPSEKYFNYYNGYLDVPVWNTQNGWWEPKILNNQQTLEWMINPSENDGEPAYIGANQNLLKLNKALHDQIDSYDFIDSASVDGYIIAGSGKATQIRFRIGDKSKMFTILMNLGDGLVPTLSATNGVSEENDKIYYSFDRSDDNVHGKMCNWLPVIYQCAEILMGHPDDLPAGITKTPPDESSLGNGYLVTLACPADLQITDSDGNIANPDNPGTDKIDYWINGDVKEAYVYDNTLQLDIMGTGDGTADLTITKYENGLPTLEYDYQTIPVNSQSEGQLDVNGQSLMELQLDSDGDGTFEESKPADRVFDLSIPEITYGDVNSDSSVNITDAVLVLKYITNPTIQIDLTAADVNGDSTTNITDAVLILKHITNPTVPFPVEG